MNYDLLALLIFGLVVLFFVWIGRKRVDFQKILFPVVYLVIYRTKWGLKAMSNFAKRHPIFVKWFGIIGVVVGYIGMVTILVTLVISVVKSFFIAGPPAVVPLLPGVRTLPGMPILSFWHWIIAIFILAIVHEFAHGIVARRYNLDVKSSGFAFLAILIPVLPAAFVEPDEKKMVKRKKGVQLSILSAGSFSNLIFATIFFLIFMFALVPITTGLVTFDGVVVSGFSENSPTNQSGMGIGEKILSIGSYDINNQTDFMHAALKFDPGDEVEFVTENGTYIVETTANPENGSIPYYGIFIVPYEQKFREDAVQKYGMFSLRVLFWIRMLVMWLFVINLGVGLFNLLPLGPLDGGRMFYLAVLHFTKKEDLSKKAWKWMSIVCLLLILFGVWPFLASFF